VGEAELQRAQLLRARQEENAKELSGLQGKLLELRERKISAKDQLMRLMINAPEAGMVMDLRYTTRGGVIAPGSQVASIVPQEERLVVDAQIHRLMWIRCASVCPLPSGFPMRRPAQRQSWKVRWNGFPRTA